MQIDNKKSIGVAERLGFYNEGVNDRDLKKNYIYSRNSTDTLSELEVFWVHKANKDTDSKIIRWAKEKLKITHDKSFASSRVILKTPWSSVMAIHTDEDTVYLKHTPPLIALEANIIEYLRDQFHAPVPTIIAKNPELNCFLMKDAGKSLRTILKETFDTDLLCKSILQFTSVQIAVSEQVDVLINMGVPDWRLNKLPDLFQEVISEKNLLIADGLSEREVNELHALLPKIRYLCQQLSGYAIKQTMVQPDFNDNNTLIDDKSKAITIIDLGEIAISHPFFSVINYLHVIKKHHALANKEEIYLKIKAACLQNYIYFESEENVLKAFEIASVLWFVYGLLAYNRLMQACDKEKWRSFEHSLQKSKLTEMLKALIVACKAYDIKL